ncbi:hypothetical protein RYH80_17360 [Halobaculum sp. MBLA0147]|uniref:hypothetical protein n=1 Tax=Halobaculum sp. MBLA0147 TaxID=3079934 RepID=UPI003526BEF4
MTPQETKRVSRRRRDWEVARGGDGETGKWREEETERLGSGERRRRRDWEVARGGDG